MDVLKLDVCESEGGWEGGFVDLVCGSFFKIIRSAVLNLET